MMTEDEKHRSVADEMEGASPYSSLQSSFGKGDLNVKGDHFLHKDVEAPLLQALKDALQQSETGAQLLQVATQYNVTIRLIKSNKLQSSVNEATHLYLSAESDQTEPQLPQILEFGGALREIEQNAVGMGFPPREEDPFERASRLHAKFLDKIVYMCKIGGELEKVYGDQILKVIDAFGFLDIYKAYVNNVGDDKIEEIYKDKARKVT